MSCETFARDSGDPVPRKSLAWHLLVVVLEVAVDVTLVDDGAVIVAVVEVPANGTLPMFVVDDNSYSMQHSSQRNVQHCHLVLGRGEKQ